MKILVTGATGFIGSNLTRELVKRGEEVNVISKTKKNYWKLSDVTKGLKFHQVDLLDSKLYKVVNKIKPDVIYHMAAYGSLPAESNSRKMFDTNLFGTINLINSLMVTGFNLFVNASSSAEYGIKTKPMKETDIPSPINDYGLSKLTQTLYVQRLAQKDNLPIVSLRLFSAYGPYEDDTRLIPTIISRMISNRTIKLSSPNYVRDFIYVGDVVEAFISCIKLKNKHGQIYNIGSGRQRSIMEVVKQAQGQTGFEGKVLWNKIPKQSRQIEPKMWQANISKSKKELKWKPSTTLPEGISKTIAWYQRHK